MSYLMIRNKGEININALVLVGASTKEDDASKIGFFGSGNKYAIATLLREGYGLKIFSGLKELPISTKKVSLGGKDFDQILVNRKPTSLTTRMGPEWEIWMALREFFCNAFDEGGYEAEEVETPEPIGGKTSIFIDYRDDVEEFFSNMDKYILQREPLETVTAQENTYNSLEAVSILDKAPGTPMNIYRKGISVIGQHDETSIFDYNCTKLKINESRIYTDESEVRRCICKALGGASTSIVKRFLSTQSSGIYETSLNWWEYAKFSEAWRTELAGKRIIPREILAIVPPEDIQGAVVLEGQLCSQLHDAFPELDIYGSKNDSWIEVEPSDFQRSVVTQAVERCVKIGIEIKPPIKFGRSTTKGTMACYSTETGEMILSVDYIKMLDTELMLTLMEENYHHNGHRDGTREFEHVLMEEVLALREEVCFLKESLNGHNVPR